MLESFVCGYMSADFGSSRFLSRVNLTTRHWAISNSHNRHWAKEEQWVLVHQ